MYIKGLLREIYLEPRVVVSAAIEKALETLRERSGLPLEIEHTPGGSECLTWLIPPRWLVEEAYISDGQHKIVDHEHHPLYVPPYSEPFEGWVSREELDRHLFSEPERPAFIPFMVDWELEFRERDWGFSLPDTLRVTLDQDRYYVCIRTRVEEYGDLTTGVCRLPGRSKREILLVTNTCHPGQINDAISGVGVALEVMRRLRDRPDLRWSYRLLLVPEYLGSAAHLDRHMDQVDHFECAMMLKILGNDAPFSLQHSSRGTHRIDRIFAHVLRHGYGAYREEGFREITGNDELFFESQGIDVPCVSLSRCRKITMQDRFFGLFEEYHSSGDEPDRLHEEKLQEAVDLVMAVIEVFEGDVVPIARFKGPINLYRHDLWLDFDKTQGAGERLNRVMALIDGGKSAFDLAEETGMYFNDCLLFLKELSRIGYVEFKEP
ncbi:DUF4910 domain-containing protein [Magnetospira sp. QH-2]|uniref:DUF4910 domain-containing protein n=1 Tax=Magnetospira sp. (strain QH-2) TaxID=1288970 RepID=UPI0003E814D2|nr:DUF4910 domain-containing protein [Magnetospira sp. QH-2]CCQ73076.1 conserved protein of unknown function [Magnetospira sp. QH-2]